MREWKSINMNRVVEQCCCLLGQLTYIEPSDKGSIRKEINVGRVRGNDVAACKNNEASFGTNESFKLNDKKNGF